VRLCRQSYAIAAEAPHRALTIVIDFDDREFAALAGLSDQRNRGS
jgi:hypothetical protein